MPQTDNSNKPSILKSTREEKGLTIEIVHEATKIPMDALRAIEEGYTVRILSPFYYRGFIKIYSEFLGLNVEETYKHYGLDQPPVKPAPSSTVRGKVSKKFAADREMGNIVTLDHSQDWLAFIFKPKTLNMALKVIGVILLFFLLFKLGGLIASHLPKKQASSKQQAGWQQEKKAKNSQKTNHQVYSAQSVKNKVEVAVRASKDVWLRVKADDKTVFETTLSKGSMESWTAKDRIEISGRDIEQLDMEVNNKQIGYLGGGDRRIKRVVITQEGLTVKK